MQADACQRATNDLLRGRARIRIDGQRRDGELLGFERRDECDDWGLTLHSTGQTEGRSWEHAGLGIPVGSGDEATFEYRGGAAEEHPGCSFKNQSDCIQ